MHEHTSRRTLVSANAPQVPHHVSVPDLLKLCCLSPLALTLPPARLSPAWSSTSHAFLALVHRPASSFALAADVVRHTEQIHPHDPMARTILRPPSSVEIAGFFPIFLALRPSIPFFASSLLLRAASALHLADSESVYGKTFELFASWVTIPTHLARTLTFCSSASQARTSPAGTRCASTAAFAGCRDRFVRRRSAL